jgi:hypothetical protein
LVAEVRLCAGLVVWNTFVLSGGLIAEGRAATAHDAAVTTNSPVVTAAAGRSKPNQPARLGSGLNRSVTAPTTAENQPRRGSRTRHHDLPSVGAAAVHQPNLRRVDCLAAILARIWSSPSAPGSSESTAICSANRSALSYSC